MSIFSKKTHHKVLFVSTEEAPFVKVGGLGEVMFSLPRYLRELGHDVRVMMPLYGTIDAPEFNLQPAVEKLKVPIGPENGSQHLVVGIKKYDPGEHGRNPVITYFVENEEYYGARSNIYGYKDDAIRFALLSRAALEFLNNESDWVPEIIGAIDWMTGFIPNFLATNFAEYARLKEIATILCIHNLESQGPLRHHQFIPEMERDDGYGFLPGFFDPRMENINAMRRGIRYADLITTVSQQYAREVTTEEFGEGLDGLLGERRERLFGVLNGLDYETQNPATDPLLTKNYTSRTLDDRAENKVALQRDLGLSEGEERFIIGIVSRLTRQKGFELLVPVIESFMNAGKAELIVVGEGDQDLMNFFHGLEKKFPKDVRAHLRFDDELPHRIFAGADVILVPSLFEPSGLTQMEAMHYGAVPIARRVGGLADTIEDFFLDEKRGTGFLFDEFDPNTLLITLSKAWATWRQKDVWKKIQKRAMEKDFSWLRSAKEYEKIFKLALRFHAGQKIRSSRKQK